jgi:hypothetical protein
MLSNKDIATRHEELARLRQVEEPEWREIARLFRPDQVGIGEATSDTAGQNSRRSGHEDLFDSTQLYALEAFEGGMFSQATNPMTPWFDLGLDDPDLARWRPVKEWLSIARRQVTASFAPAAGGFYSETPAWFGDTGAFGMGTFYSEEDVGRQRFIDKVIPLDQIFIDVDLFGEVSTVHRSWMARGRQIKGWFGSDGDLGKLDDGKAVRLIHAVFANPDYREGALGPRGMAWASVYMSPDIKDWRREGGYREMPFHIIPWKRRPGRVYPTGPGHIARPDTAMLQEMERTHIVAAQFAAEPPTLAHDESVLTAADLVPNAFLYGTMNDQGKQLLSTLKRGEEVGLSMAQSDQRRAAIREAFFFSILQLVNRPQMTATEFLGFREESLRLMAPNLVRVQTYGLSPLIARRFHALVRARQIPLPPPEMANRLLGVEYVSPLAKALKAAEGKATMQWVLQMRELSAVDPTVMDNVDLDEVSRVTADAFGPPPSVVRDPREVAALRQGRAAQQQQQVAIDQAQQVVSTMAEAAHAAQATTLAGQRQAGGR